MWVVDSDANVLRCLKVWHPPAMPVDKFVSASYQRTFAPGIGLPGRVWASLKPAWIRDVTRDENCPRAPMAAMDGLHAAFAFPILSGAELLAVVEFSAMRSVNLMTPCWQCSAASQARLASSWNESGLKSRRRIWRASSNPLGTQSSANRWRES